MLSSLNPPLFYPVSLCLQWVPTARPLCRCSSICFHLREVGASSPSDLLLHHPSLWVVCWATWWITDVSHWFFKQTFAYSSGLFQQNFPIPVSSSLCQGELLVNSCGCSLVNSGANELANSDCKWVLQANVIRDLIKWKIFCTPNLSFSIPSLATELNSAVTVSPSSKKKSYKILLLSREEFSNEGNKKIDKQERNL